MTVLGEAPPANPASVGAEEGAAVVARDVRQASQVRAVGVHQVNVRKVGFVAL